MVIHGGNPGTESGLQAIRAFFSVTVAKKGASPLAACGGSPPEYLGRDEATCPFTLAQIPLAEPSGTCRAGDLKDLRRKARNLMAGGRFGC